MNKSWTGAKLKFEEYEYLNQFKMSEGRHLAISELLFFGSFIANFLGNKMTFNLS